MLVNTLMLKIAQKTACFDVPWKYGKKRHLRTYFIRLCKRLHDFSPDASAGCHRQPFSIDECPPKYDRIYFFRMPNYLKPQKINVMLSEAMHLLLRFQTHRCVQSGTFRGFLSSFGPSLVKIRNPLKRRCRRGEFVTDIDKNVLPGGYSICPSGFPPTCCRQLLQL